MYCQNNDCLYYRGGEGCPVTDECPGYNCAQESCTNCLYEYTCDWEWAGDRGCCENWRNEDER